MTTFTMGTIGDAERELGRQNNFLLIRLVAAIAVIYGHSYAISPRDGHIDIFSRYISGTWSGGIALFSFFVISGFLVTASYLHRNNLKEFLTARILRIFPGLIACVAATIFILGPLTTTLTLSGYFHHPEVHSYFWNNVLLIQVQYVLPGVFEHMPSPGVNGPIWSLFLECRLYLVVGLLGLLGILKRPRLLVAVGVAFIFVGLYYPLWLSYLANNALDLECGFLFLAGGLIYVYRNRIPLNAGFLLFFLFMTVLFHGTNRFLVAFNALLIYGVLWLAYIPKLPALNRIGDYSYGIYIYGWPMQQLMKSLFPGTSPLQNFALALPAAFALAVLSWHLIEKPALSLKNLSAAPLIFIGRIRLEMMLRRLGFMGAEGGK